MKKGDKPVEVHVYTIRMDIGTPHELTERRMAALASRLSMLFTNMGYTLWQDDDAVPLHVEGHSVEAIQ